MPHRLLKQRLQRRERCASSTYLASYERCSILDSPDEEVWPSNGNYSRQPALATSDTHAIIQAVTALIDPTRVDMTAPIYISKHVVQHSVNQYRQQRRLPLLKECYTSQNSICSVRQPQLGVSRRTAWNKLLSNIRYLTISLVQWMKCELLLLTFCMAMSVNTACPQHCSTCSYTSNNVQSSTTCNVCMKQSTAYALSTSATTPCIGKRILQRILSGVKTTSPAKRPIACLHTLE